MKRKFVLISMVFALLFVFAAAASAAVAHGDVDGNGKVEAADARLALRIAVNLKNEGVENYHPEAADVEEKIGTVDAADARKILRAAVSLDDLTDCHTPVVVPGTEATCTAAGVSDGSYCAVCEKVLKEQAPIPPQHDYSGIAKDPAAKIVCAKCGKETPSFNDLVNALKTENHYFTGFTRTVTSGTLQDSDFKVTGIDVSGTDMEEMVREAFSDGMLETGEEFTDRQRTPRLIKDDSFEVFGKPYVSALTAADITGLRIEEMNGIDFLAELPDSASFIYGNATVKEDLTNLKNTSIGSVKKVTVTLKQEKYSQLKKSSEESALQRILDTDLRELAAGSEQSVSEEVELFALPMKMTMNMTCSEIVSDAEVSYYVDAETNAPIAAKYRTKMNVSEKAEMNLTGRIGLIKYISGKMVFAVDNDASRYCFFDNYFRY